MSDKSNNTSQASQEAVQYPPRPLTDSEKKYYGRWVRNSDPKNKLSVAQLIERGYYAAAEAKRTWELGQCFIDRR